MMKPDTITTIREALRIARVEAESAFIYGDDELIARIDAAIADLTTQAEQQGAQWTPLLDDYWGYFNVERNGRVVTICTDVEFETSQDYIVVPLPDNVFVCHLTPAQLALEGDMPLISNDELDRMVSAIRDETSRDTAFELLVRVRGTYERERRGLDSQRQGQPPAPEGVTQLEQLDKDWLAMLRAIAKIADVMEADKAEPDNEWCEADDATLLEQFDPWQTLREVEAELTQRPPASQG